MTLWHAQANPPITLAAMPSKYIIYCMWAGVPVNCVQCSCSTVYVCGCSCSVLI